MSRIHVHVPMGHLTFDQREKIWDRFLSKLPARGLYHNLNAADRAKLARWDINGRQIKNAFQLLSTVGKPSGEPITRADVERMIRMSCPTVQPQQTIHRVDAAEDLISLDLEPISVQTLISTETPSLTREIYTPPGGVVPTSASASVDLLSLDWPSGLAVAPAAPTADPQAVETDWLSSTPADTFVANGRAAPEAAIGTWQDQHRAPVQASSPIGNQGQSPPSGRGQLALPRSFNVQSPVKVENRPRKLQSPGKTPPPIKAKPPKLRSPPLPNS